MVNLCLWSHGAKWTTSHDAIWNVFTFIMRNAGFHVLHEQIHVFLQFSLKSFCQQVDIMSSVDDICTLANVYCQSHSNRFGFMCCFISHSDFNSGDSRKRRTFQQWALYEHISSPCHTSFWLPTLIAKWFFSSMCQHGMISKRHQWPSSSCFASFL
jgi:hypothetical protein